MYKNHQSARCTGIKTCLHTTIQIWMAAAAANQSALTPHPDLAEYNMGRRDDATDGWVGPHIVCATCGRETGDNCNTEFYT